MATLIVPLAVGLASRALISLLTPTQVQEGQRLDDLDVPKSEYGYNLSKPFGRVRYNGANTFWGLPLREEVNESGGGGKGAGNKNKLKEYTYYGTFAVNFGYDPCIITRIWLNGKLFYNPLGIQDGTQAESVDVELDSLEIYGGTATQVASPTIEGVEGVGNVPGFRRRPYIVFNDLELTAEFNSAIPKVDVEVIADYTDTLTNVNADPTVIYATVGNSSNVMQSTWNQLLALFQANDPSTQSFSYPLNAFKTTLGDILRYLGDDVGMVENTDYEIFYDLFANGANFKQNGDTYKQFLEDLQRTYNFLAVSEGGKINFIPQDGYGTPLALVADDLGSREAGDSLPDKYIERRTEETELPTSILFDYKNVNKDHQRGVAQATRHISTHRNEVRYNTDCVLADTEALTAANRNLYQSWAQRQRVEGLKLLPQYIEHVKPGFIVTVPIRGTTVELQIDKVSIGANYLLETSGVITDYSITSEDIDKGTDTDYPTEGDIDTFDSIAVIILDIPLLSDVDAFIESGLYGGGLGFSDDSWAGGTIIEAPTATTSFSNSTTVPAKINYGFLSTDVPFKNPFVVDETTTITVIMANGTLESITQAAFDATLENIMIIQDTGEIIAFRDATLVGPDTYEITYLARGLYGTEKFIGNPTSSGSGVYFLRNKNNFRRFIRGTSDITQTFDYKAVYPGENVLLNPNTFTQTYAGISLRPYAPINPELTLDSSPNDLLLSWTRRTRYGGDWTQSTLVVPVNEEQEEFEIEILDAPATSILRTVTVIGASEYRYLNADIISDFGSVPATLDFNVYQISAVFGRGLSLEARDVPISEVI